MYLIELIGRMIVNLLKQAWLLPRTVGLAFQEKRRQTIRLRFETERLDRIRNPWRYIGR